MKQCKVCGTLVHIDSNTCPSCGNHNFFVLDVKICPLCGKVNNITSSFCEQCGKQFVTAQGVSFAKKIPVQRAERQGGLYRERAGMYPKQEESEKTQQKNEDSEFDIEKPVIKTPKSLIIEENAAERAYKDFIALKPEVMEKEDYSEFSYYVKGDATKLPVIILPKFAKTSGKNIIVNIVVNNQDKPEELKNSAGQPYQEIKPAPEKEKTEMPFKPAAENAAPYFNGGKEDAAGSFKPFSVISEEAKPEIQKDVYEKGIDSITEEIEFEGGKEDEKLKEKLLKDLKIDTGKKHKEKKIKVKTVKKPKADKEPLAFGSQFASVVLIVLALGALASFTMVFYTSENIALRSAGLSPVLYLINSLTGKNITLPFAFDNGYAAYAANYHSGQFAHLAHLVPYLFTAPAVLLLFAFFVNLFTFRHKMWAKVTLFFTSGLTLACELAIVLAMKYVFNSGGMTTLGLGLILVCVISFIYFVTLLIAYRPVKKD